MTGTLPPWFLTEVRLVFQKCAGYQNRCSNRHLSSTRPHLFRQSQARTGRRNRNIPVNDTQPPTAAGEKAKVISTDLSHVSRSSAPSTPQQSHSLIPRKQDDQSIGGRRTVDAPMKIIPKAEITPKLKLSPRERLHVEILTRRPPPVVKQGKPYKEKLLIYHHGNLSENALIFWKIFGWLWASAATMVVVPAYYFAGSPIWLCGFLFVGGWSPIVLFHHILKPLVTRVHLRLPQTARASPEAAMKYAKNLPSSAQMDISFNRMTALPGTVTVDVADLRPIPKGSLWPWQSANLQWTGNRVEKGSIFRPNPIQFSVKPEVGAGRARRDVIPGIWPQVFDRLLGGPKEPASKWR